MLLTPIVTWSSMRNSKVSAAPAAGHRHEGDRQNVTLCHYTCRVLGNQHQLLIGVTRADRDHHTTIGGKLLEQGWWQFGCRGGDDNCVEWRALWPAQAAVAGVQFDVPVALSCQCGSCTRGKLGDDLNRAHLGG